MAAESRGFLRAPLTLALGVPVAAGILLALVALGGWDEPLFFVFNRLPELTGDALWAHVTVLGDGLVAAVLILPWIRRHPERVWGGLLGAVVMVVILHLFKGLFNLPRPLGVLPEDVVHVIGPGHRRSAFPSGHTATAFLLAGVWALSTPRRLLALAAVSGAALVGISRMAVGVHWPTDVLGGAVLGWGAAWIGLRAAERWPWGTRPLGRRVLGVALLVSALVLFLLDHTGYPGVLLFQRSLALACLVAGGVQLWFDVTDPHAGDFRPEPVDFHREM